MEVWSRAGRVREGGEVSARGSSRSSFVFVFDALADLRFCFEQVVPHPNVDPALSGHLLICPDSRFLSILLFSRLVSLVVFPTAEEGGDDKNREASIREACKHTSTPSLTISLSSLDLFNRRDTLGAGADLEASRTLIFLPKPSPASSSLAKPTTTATNLLHRSVSAVSDGCWRRSSRIALLSITLSSFVLLFSPSASPQTFTDVLFATFAATRRSYSPNLRLSNPSSNLPSSPLRNALFPLDSSRLSRPSRPRDLDDPRARSFRGPQDDLAQFGFIFLPSYPLVLSRARSIGEIDLPTSSSSLDASILSTQTSTSRTGLPPSSSAL